MQRERTAFQENTRRLCLDLLAHLRQTVRSDSSIKPPLVVALTVAFMGMLLSASLLLAFLFGDMAAVFGALGGCLAIGRVILGLWRGERWAWNGFRALLLAATIVSSALIVVPTHAGRISFVARTAVMGLWLWWLSRPSVRAFVGRIAAGAVVSPPAKARDTTAPPA
jgi:hypothetical protein